MPSAKKATEEGHPDWSIEKELEAFKSIPNPDTAQAKEQLRDVVEVCELIGETESLN